MKYDPKQASTCWAEGDYPAVIHSVEAKTSQKSGAEMEVVTFEVFGDAGKTIRVKDYIVGPTATSNGTVFKIKRIAKALGKEHEFKTGAFQVGDNIGANLVVSLGIDEQPGYDEKNVIDGYKPSAGVAVTPSRAAQAKQHTPITEDDIPF